MDNTIQLVAVEVGFLLKGKGSGMTTLGDEAVMVEAGPLEETSMETGRVEFQVRGRG